MKKHKTFSHTIGTSGEYDVYTACGLGDGGDRETQEFDVAQKDSEVTCKSCLRSMAKRDRLSERMP